MTLSDYDSIFEGDSYNSDDIEVLVDSDADKDYDRIILRVEI